MLPLPVQRNLFVLLGALVGLIDAVRDGFEGPTYGGHHGGVIQSSNTAPIHLHGIVHNTTDAFGSLPKPVQVSELQLPFEPVRALRHHAKHQNTSSAADTLMYLGGGIGSGINKSVVNRSVDHDLVKRMRYQDKALVWLIVAIYFIALFFTAHIEYNHAFNHSPVTYYADPHHSDVAVEGNDVSGFLEAFHQAPKNVSLQVTGYEPLPVENGPTSFITWRGQAYRIAFSFSLDLSAWVVRGADGARPSSDAVIAGESLGVSAVEMEKLRSFLHYNTNDLATVELRQEVSWHSWEELATNIKHQIRQRGFSGIISVHRSAQERVKIFKNKPWAIFLRSHSTEVLCALSLVGWAIFWPYVWVRSKIVPIRLDYHVDIDIADYWELVRDKFTANGFEDVHTDSAQMQIT